VLAGPERRVGVASGIQARKQEQHGV
jgi:hypothetical protein